MPVSHLALSLIAKGTDPRSGSVSLGINDGFGARQQNGSENPSGSQVLLMI